MEPDTAQASFHATLSAPARRLAGRLEGFGDIVFGFAVSQCALQLPTVRGHVDLAHPVALFSYFGTFALLASLWLTYHRVLSGTYRPTPPDLVLAFAYLALVSLMPYAMYSISHDVRTLDEARAAVAEYAILFAVLMALAAAITLRNLRRGWSFLDDGERLDAWIALLRRCTLCLVMALAVAIDVAFGPTWSSVAFVAIPVALRVVRFIARRYPVPRSLRLAPQAATASTIGPYVT